MIDLPPDGAYQGDIRIIPVSALPTGLTRTPAVQGRHVVAHSETGHHHTVLADGAVFFGAPAGTLVSYLQVDADFVDLQHSREVHRHETIRIPRGTYQIVRQRESSPAGWRVAKD